MLPIIRRFEFLSEGVTVILPFQGRSIRIFQLPLNPNDEMPVDQRNFNIVRNVINLKLSIDEGGNSMITEFDPPIELQVKYTSFDYAASSGKLNLTYWDGNKWVYFADVHQNYQLLPFFPDRREIGGIAIVRISAWDDPHIAWVD